MDSYSLDFPGFEVDTSITGKRLCGVLDRLVWFNGVPEMIMVENGPEFISKVLDSLAYGHKVKLVFNRPSKPVDNASLESLNGRLRNECLNMNWFMSLDHARQVIKAWREECQTVLPHGGLGGLKPEKFWDRENESFHKQVVL